MSRRGAYDYLAKLLLIGDSGVGKSCLMLRFADDSFQPSFITTIGIDFKMRTVKLDGKTVKLQIWDTAGQERFRSVTTAYYRGATGILLVYDVTDEQSFGHITSWMRNVEQHAPSGARRVLVGNKCDLTRVITSARGAALAAAHGIGFFETSAKEASGVEDAFMALVRQVVAALEADADVTPPLEYGHADPKAIIACGGGGAEKECAC